MKDAIRLQPILKTYVWGTESWEVSDRDEGMSVALDGGQSLREILGKRFPLLVKVIDARETLSIQVHPRVAHGAAEPKTEMWVALAPSSVYAGFVPGVQRADVEARLGTPAFVELLQTHTLGVGDVLYIPSGTIHAICGGSKLLEIQQNSNTTYRLYDWGRARPLHVQEGLAALDLASHPHVAQLPVRSPYFEVERLDVRGRYALSVQEPAILFCMSGSVELAGFSLRESETALVLHDAMLTGEATLILTRPPQGR